MNRRPRLRTAYLLALVLSGCLAVAGVAVAQEGTGGVEAMSPPGGGEPGAMYAPPGAAESAAETSPSESAGGGGPVWVVPYAVIILSIAGAMFIVCSSARRRDREKPESYKSTLAAELGKQ